MFTGSKCATRTVRIASPSCTFRVQSENSASAIDGRPLVVEIQLSPILGQIGDLLGEQFQQSVLDCDHCIFNHFKDV